MGKPLFYINKLFWDLFLTTRLWSSGNVYRLCDVPAVVQVLQKQFSDLKCVEY